VGASKEADESVTGIEFFLTLSPMEQALLMLVNCSQRELDEISSPSRWAAIEKHAAALRDRATSVGLEDVEGEEDIRQLMVGFDSELEELLSGGEAPE
jgi:hypothetical protein